MIEKNHIERFNHVSENYVEDLNKNLRLTGGSSDYFYRCKLTLIRDHLKTQPERILDFGCAVGAFTKLLAEAFPKSRVHGYDPAADCVESARAANGRIPNLQFLNSVDNLTEKFDLIVVAGVLHHIPPKELPSVIAKLRTLLSTRGELFIFEHNPWSPLTRLIVKLAPVDKDANLLFRKKTLALLKNSSFQEIKSPYISLFPPFLGFLFPIEKFFGWFPLSAQYMIQAKMSVS